MDHSMKSQRSALRVLIAKGSVLDTYIHRCRASCRDRRWAVEYDEEEGLETDTTDCSCMELYSRNAKYHQTVARPPTLRAHQSHTRVNTNSCARCRKRKPGNPKNPQHCPSCLCPPDVVRSSSGRLRGSENMEEVLARFEEITREPGEPGPSKSSNLKHTVAQSKNQPTKSNAKKSTCSLNRQKQKSEHDQMLNALYHDLMSSGLATEETQGFSRYEAPIKSVRKKSNLQTERNPLPLPLPSGNHQDAVDLDSDAVLRYLRDYKNPKDTSSNILSQKEDSVKKQRRDLRQENVPGGTRVQRNNIEEDEQLRQFEIDKRELDELGQELREFEIKKNKGKREGEQVWEKHEKIGPNDDGDQLKRRVSFLPSKLPVPMYGGQGTRSRSPPGDHMDRCDENGKVEAMIGYESTSNLENNPHDHRYDEELEDFDYPKEFGESLSQDLKDISYCDVPYRCPSAPIQRTKKTEEQNATVISGIQRGQEKSDQLLPEDPPKKYVYAGGDLDLHASKSYIVDLIDRALSRELGTVPEERKIESLADPSQSQKDICVEIARALQGDGCMTTYGKSSKNIEKKAPEYVRHLKVLRWDYLNHIQDELKKLQDLERILDTYSPRQSLPPLQSKAASSLDQKKNRQAII